MASTILNEEGDDPDVIERQLAHVEANKVRAAYHRVQYVGERRKVMQEWANLMDSLVTILLLTCRNRNHNHECNNTKSQIERHGEKLIHQKRNTTILAIFDI